MVFWERTIFVSHSNYVKDNWASTVPESYQFCDFNFIITNSDCSTQDLMCRELTTCVRCHLENPCSEPPCPVDLMNCPNSGYICQNRTFMQVGGDEAIPGMCLIGIVLIHSGGSSI